MLCTKCNSPITPVVAVDIDGTLGDYHGHFTQFAEDYVGRPLKESYNGSGPYKDWFCAINGISYQIWHDIKLAYRQGGMKRCMPVYSHAAEMCQDIKNAGAELWLTTTRPYIRHDSVDPDTREWLRRNNIPYDYLVYDGNKYKKLHDIVGDYRVCAVLDDLIEEVYAAMAIFGSSVPILRNNSYNSAVSFPNSCRSLEEATLALQDRIEIWKELDDNSGHTGSSDADLRASE